MRSDTMEKVGHILREAAAKAILPRFQKLLAGNIEEKTPGEVVTIADREAERIIGPQLAALLDGSRVVGEEAVGSDASLMKGLDEGQVWLVDPLDGTSNFIEGSLTFSVRVALLQDGETIASWLLAPVSGELSIACRGGGAFTNGEPVRASSTPLSALECRGSVLTRFLPEELKEQVRAGSAGLGEILPGAKCAGVDYPAIIKGTQHSVLFWRLLPWDHAPGALLLSEAGGYVARLDETAYKPADQRPGLLAAQNQEVWNVVRTTLLSQ